MKLKKKKLTGSTLVFLLLILGAIISIFPVFWALSTSLKSTSQVFSDPLGWIPHPFEWSNYVHVWTVEPFGRYIFNTFFVSIVTALGQMLFGALGAYAFARMKFVGKNVIFGMYLSTMMVPPVVTMIPLFILMKHLGWINTYYALIAPTVLGTPLGIFLLRQFFLTIPIELEEAARIDGASVMRIFWRIILPMTKPALTTLGLISFVMTWNNFIWPVIVINSDRYKVLTLAVAGFQTQYGSEWNYLMVVVLLTTIPLLIIFILFQRYIINGIQLSASK
ncbi:carbohydrate ABC transporter permease [Alicyclobacillus sp. SO9]|uniref:carbohydrate ABC transporter permease n=1 Tax=Alicyclobacillus sp. SO9 TaxID=2665646 RepID=UPI0018E7630E|nr:carbohydrate ABC transporter permease [Alicyclobacillus sp. SO9]QQE77998.1 carbohydrate ABC transporter permease [Alicyclobacillus sp. SO9]